VVVRVIGYTPNFFHRLFYFKSKKARSNDRIHGILIFSINFFGFRVGGSYFLAILYAVTFYGVRLERWIAPVFSMDRPDLDALNFKRLSYVLAAHTHVF